MTYKANLLTDSISEKNVLDPGHEAVVLGFTAKADQTPAVLPAGLVVAIETASGGLVPYDPAGVDGSENPRGVLLSKVDTATGAGNVARVIIHGTVVRENIFVDPTAQNAVDDTDIMNLISIGVYPV